MLSCRFAQVRDLEQHARPVAAMLGEHQGVQLLRQASSSTRPPDAPADVDTRRCRRMAAICTHPCANSWRCFTAFGAQNVCIGRRRPVATGTLADVSRAPSPDNYPPIRPRSGSRRGRPGGWRAGRAGTPALRGRARRYPARRSDGEAPEAPCTKIDTDKRERNGHPGEPLLLFRHPPDGRAVRAGRRQARPSKDNPYRALS